MSHAQQSEVTYQFTTQRSCAVFLLGESILILQQRCSRTGMLDKEHACIEIARNADIPESCAGLGSQGCRRWHKERMGCHRSKDEWKYLTTFSFGFFLHALVLRQNLAPSLARGSWLLRRFTSDATLSGCCRRTYGKGAVNGQLRLDDQL